MNANADLKIRANTRYAFSAIALMLLAFLVFVVVTLVPFGLNGMQKLSVIRFALYALVLFAVLGGFFSVRVAALRKKAGK
ncbi:cytochrome b6 [Neisseria perflava]|uniref:cytochrome b6 n=1 Tax=Neisseria perflava TaxID=33053 RepID=UPI00209E01BF|nr:cytochrome b6 [Neisseria perflava]MCP1660422.1 hypothetical protein [Neisseria perflava]MCP1772104.1 hypothetical protein [Neisseria perflava]